MRLIMGLMFDAAYDIRSQDLSTACLSTDVRDKQPSKSDVNRLIVY